MNNTQKNAIAIPKSPWLMDPITYELALQVLNDAIIHYNLELTEKENAQAAMTELNWLHKHSLANYQPLKRQPRPMNQK